MKNANSCFCKSSPYVSRRSGCVERSRFSEFLFLTLLLVSASSRAAPDTALEDYVAAPDPAYDFHQVRALTGSDYTEYHLDMTSQRWQATEVDRPLWQHRLIIIVPETVSSSTALLNVGDGVTGDDAEASFSEREWARNTNTVVASLRAVPNQPLVFTEDSAKRWENEILGHSFTKFLDTGNETWPGVLPMAKSAVRTMDTVQTFVAEETDAGPIESFVVSGISKRGWTAWLAAIVDSRVKAIIPVVYDALNLNASMQHQRRAYEGVTRSIVRGYADLLEPYVDMYERLSTPEGEALLDIIDPYEYRDRLTLPKFLIHATGDQFFLPDSTQFYFHELVGPKYLRYVPNSDHFTVLSSVSATGGFQNFYESVIRDEPLPQFTWTVEPDGSIRVVTETIPLEVKQWQATNPTHRDFRVGTIGRVWSSSPLDDQGEGIYIGGVTDPPAGYTAFFVELTFPSSGTVPHTFTTEVVCSCITAEFAVSEVRGEAPFEVTLDASATVSTGSEISSWVWDFGDGFTGEGAVVQYTYDRPGRFIVRLTATDVFGRTDSTQKSVEVSCRVTDVAPWMTADIGDVQISGSARLERPGDEAFRVCAAGTGIGGIADQCFLMYREFPGDLELTARLSNVTGGLSGASVGLMLRGGLESGASSAAVLLELRGSPPARSGRFRFRYRSTAGAAAGSRSGDSIDTPEGWVRLERTGDTVTAWSSVDGSEWTPIGDPQVLPGLPETVLAGIVAVGNDREIETATFEPLQAVVSELKSGGTRFIRGDANDDSLVNISDPVHTLNWLFSGGPATGCLSAANVNGDEAVNISDPTYLLNHLFSGGPAPIPPFPDCGVSERAADQELGCETAPASCQ